MRDLARKFAIVAVLMVLWEVAARLADTPLVLPTFLATMTALAGSLTAGDTSLLGYVAETCKSLFLGFAIGSMVAAVLTVFAVNTKIGEEFLSTITAGFAPLPAVAVFPISLIVFGISLKSVVFIAAFAATFPVAVSMFQGFAGVSQTLRNVGRNFGMSSLGLTLRVLIPAALPAILSGLRNGFSNSFRALVAVEMVIGAASGAGGLGWFILSQKNDLAIDLVYGGILAVMVIGLLFEGAFKLFENATIRRWGMKH